MEVCLGVDWHTRTQKIRRSLSTRTARLVALAKCRRGHAFERKLDRSEEKIAEYSLSRHWLWPKRCGRLTIKYREEGGKNREVENFAVLDRVSKQASGVARRMKQPRRGGMETRVRP